MLLAFNYVDIPSPTHGYVRNNSSRKSVEVILSNTIIECVMLMAIVLKLEP